MSAYLRLLSYGAPYWRGWLAIAAATVLTTGVSLLEPWPMQVFVDHVLGGQSLSGWLERGATLFPGASTREGLLVWVVLAGLLIFVLRSTLNVLLSRAAILVGQQMVLDLARDVFARIQRRSLLFHRRHPVGDSMARITEDSWCVNTLADELLLKSAHVLISGAGMLTVMVSMDVGLTVLSVAVAPVMAVSSVIVGRPLRALARIRQDIEGRLKSHVHQTLGGVSVVQGFSQEDGQRRRFQEFTAEAIRVNRRSALTTALYQLTANGIGTLGLGAVLWLGARHTLDGQLTVGRVLVFFTYLTLLQEQFKILAEVYRSMQDVGGSVDRILEVLGAEREVRDRPGARPLSAIQGAIRLERVSFGYEPGQPVLRDVSLDIRPGQTVAIVGATGAGKSTLVSLVPRFFDVWGGRVLVDGQDVREVQLRSLRAHVALVLQESFLFPLSIANNIAYGRPSAAQAEIEAAARAANAHAFIERLPAGYDTLVGEQGATLSGGERQRVAIARALLKDAPILILDEPTSALDAETEAQLLEAMHRLMTGRTTLMIAHRLSTLRNADWIAVLDNGTLVESGTHQQLLARNGTYARFFHLQSATPAAVGNGRLHIEQPAPTGRDHSNVQLSGTLDPS